MTTPRNRVAITRQTASTPSAPHRKRKMYTSLYREVQDSARFTGRDVDGNKDLDERQPRTANNGKTSDDFVVRPLKVVKKKERARQKTLNFGDYVDRADGESNRLSDLSCTVDDLLENGTYEDAGAGLVDPISPDYGAEGSRTEHLEHIATAGSALRSRSAASLARLRIDRYLEDEADAGSSIDTLGRSTSPESSLNPFSDDLESLVSDEEEEDCLPQLTQAQHARPTPPDIFAHPERGKELPQVSFTREERSAYLRSTRKVSDADLVDSPQSHRASRSECSVPMYLSQSARASGNDLGSALEPSIELMEGAVLSRRRRSSSVLEDVRPALRSPQVQFEQTIDARSAYTESTIRPRQKTAGRIPTPGPNHFPFERVRAQPSPSPLSSSPSSSFGVPDPRGTRARHFQKAMGMLTGAITPEIDYATGEELTKHLDKLFKPKASPHQKTAKQAHYAPSKQHVPRRQDERRQCAEPVTEIKRSGSKLRRVFRKG